MNNLDNNILFLLYKHLDNKTNNEFRQCSSYLSKVIGTKYFSRKVYININKINNKHLFRYFVHKYKLIPRIVGVKNNKQLAYLNTYGIKFIYFYDFDQLYFEYVLPPTLKKLILFDDFNMSVKRIVLPSHHGLYDLLIGSFDNEDPLLRPSLGPLPKTLESLTFNYDFNQPLPKKVFPQSLKKLYFGDSFNQEIKKNILPATLKKLVFGCDFNQVIEKNILPSKLHTLKFGARFDQPINNLLPLLHTLIFGEDFNQPINNLPPLLHTLIFGYYFNQSINNLPSFLHTLIFGYHFNQPIKENIFPLSLRILKFGHHFNQPINKELLPQLQEFKGNL